MSEVKEVSIDGSLLEGGGQILRNSVTLSCLMNHQISLINIRANRLKPGLKAQHLKGLELVAEICNAYMEGGFIGSSKILLNPKLISGGSYQSDVKTAGSVCLLMQIALPCLCFADVPSTITLKGGTNAEMAPPIDYHEKVFKYMALKFGMVWECDVVKRGFFPKGGGEVRITINPIYKLKPVTLIEFGEVTKIYGLAYVAGMLNLKAAQTIAESAKSKLRSRFANVNISIDVVKYDSSKATGTGCGVTLIAETSTGCILGASSVGRKGKAHEQVGGEAATELTNDILSLACVDSHMQDQIILFMALADGCSRIKTGSLTLHTKTAIFIAEKLTKAKFKIENVTGSENCIIECQGIGYAKK